jgi:predicted phosphodiesterase
MKLAWATDIHLDMAKEPVRRKFYKSIRDSGCEALVVTGDLAHGHTMEIVVPEMAEAVALPVYFVLGNHDFYSPLATVTVKEIRQIAREMCAAQPRLHYLPSDGIVELGKLTALVGHDGWADGRAGTWNHSMEINDEVKIADLAKFRHDRKALLRVIQGLAQESAEYFREILPRVFKDYLKVIVATHVPPFREATWHQGVHSDAHALPWFCNKVVGDTLREVMDQWPECELTVLCGHTHGGGEAQILSNLKVWTGEAKYGLPALQRVIEIGA